MASKAEKRDWLAFLHGKGVPPFVKERLSKANRGELPWVSSGGAAELLLCNRSGLKPVGVVMGTCWVRYGRSWTEGHMQGWRTALSRLKAEAVAAGANAVVDIRMKTVQAAIDSSMDFSLVGTAVRVDSIGPSRDPVCTTCSGFELIRLLEAGIVPMGLATGACYEWLTDSGYQFYNLRKSWTAPSQPVDGLRNFWETVRRTAHARLRADVEAQGATGALANIHFGQLLCFERDKNPDQYLGRHIVVATTIDRMGKVLPPEVNLVIEVGNSIQTNSSKLIYSNNLDKESAI